MTPEIKRLLKLSSIPGFKLSPKEEAKLAEWKNMQEAVIVKKPRRRTKKNKVKVVENVVTDEDKVLNTLES